MAWTAQRIAAGQDPDYNRELADWNNAVAAQERTAQARPPKNALTLFTTGKDGELKPNPKAITK